MTDEIREKLQRRAEESAAKVRAKQTEAERARLLRQLTEARAQLAESTARLVAAKLREAKIEDLVTDTLRRVYHLPADCVPGGEQRERLLAVAEVCVAYDLRVGAEGRALDTFKAFLAALPAR